MFKVF
ncbi:hypothetical protein NQ317_018926 [Molorchus minor]